MILNLASTGIPSDWCKILEEAIRSDSYRNLHFQLLQESSNGTEIYPASDHIFRAFELVPFHEVKVVILGQDPYHSPGQAIGLSFAVPNELDKKPPSLRNLFRELVSDLGVDLMPGHSDLTGWAAQGVLLLNTCLTVRAGQPLSHSGAGWEEFTKGVMDSLAKRKEGCVFLLLGAHAQSFKPDLTTPQHRIIKAPHPSPLSAYRGFFGSRIYSRTNAALRDLGLDPIDWEKISLK
jgi:uracil-DNA glycosylase